MTSFHTFGHQYLLLVSWCVLLIPRCPYTGKLWWVCIKVHLWFNPPVTTCLLSLYQTLSNFFSWCASIHSVMILTIQAIEPAWRLDVDTLLNPVPIQDLDAWDKHPHRDIGKLPMIPETIPQKYQQDKWSQDLTCNTSPTLSNTPHQGVATHNAQNQKKEQSGLFLEGWKTK